MITFPELEKYNGSYFDAYKAIYCITAYEVEQLRSLFPEGAIDDINGYKIRILTKIMHASYSFVVIIEQAHDYSSAANILRSIADNLASYILVYHDKNKDELLLRHFLFLYDGLDTRLKGRLAITLDPNTPISKSEKDDLRKIMDNATLDDENAIDFCLKKIRSNNLYNKYSAEIEYLIKHKKWKYTSLTKYKEQYTWEKMYPFINGKESSSIFISYLSQYVHGLSSSNLIYNTSNPNTFYELIGIGITFLGKINDFAQNDFGIKKEELYKNFFQSDFSKDYLSHISPDFFDSLFMSKRE